MKRIDCSCGAAIFANPGVFVTCGHCGMQHMHSAVFDENIQLRPGAIFIMKDHTVSMYDPTALETVIEAPKTCFIERHAPGCECGVL